MKTRRFAVALALVTFVGTGPALAQDKGKTEAAKLASESRAALKKLTATVPLARQLETTAVAVLVFPQITKAGFGFGPIGIIEK